MPFAALGAPRSATLARDRLASPLSSSRAAPAPPARAMAPRARADGSAPPKTVLVAGAGIIGTSIAYHLAVNHGIGATLVDKVGPHCAASGKAGGFLALDWCDGSPLGPLARASFAMHDALAETLALDSYRRLTCEAVALDPRRAEGAIPPREPLSKKLLSRVEWADASSVSGSRPMGDERTIAQVHPAQLCDAMLRRAEAVAGAKVIVGDVSALSRDPATGACVGLVVDGEVIRADAVVVAMGPWTSRVLSAAAEIPGAPAVPAVPAVYGQKYHAVLMRPASGRVLTQAVFFQGLGDPEFYPRPDGDVYVCAFPDPPGVVAEEPGAVEIRPDAVERLVDVARRVSSEMADATVSPSPNYDAAGAPGTRGQACHLPVTEDGLPVMGRVPGCANAFVAAGHSCWGILNAPASGAAMAELVAEGRVTCVEGFDAFDPARRYQG